MADVGVLILVVYSIMETLEKFGLRRTLAHLLAIPIGLLSSFLFLQGSCPELLVKGLLIGFGSVGTCDTSCNIADLIKSRLFKNATKV